jgi:integrative and conjugative element protein (TIGR02256 family)
MNLHRAKKVHVIVPRSALAVIFDECDRFDQDETGGRVIGTFQEHRGRLTLNITGIIESGPQAQRSPVSFFQDGEHQEGVFREIERSHPEIEHLGNWHTHHVNGLSTLSNGDLATYRRTVNHHNHNTSFFYALLVVARRHTADPLERYNVKHYIFHRDDDRVHEIPHKSVEIVDAPLVWPVERTKHSRRQVGDGVAPRPERVYDRDMLNEFYRELRPYSSQKLGLYWRGPLELVNGTKVEVVLVEDASSGAATYSITLRDPPHALRATAEQLAEHEFTSARSALVMAERSCNRVLYQQFEQLRETKSSH